MRGCKGDAERLLRQLLLSVDEGTYIKQPKQLTVANWLQRWLDNCVANNLSPKTVESYEHELCCYVIPSLGGIRLTELRPHHIQGFISKELSEGRKRGVGGLSPRTVQYHYRILSKALDDAMKMGLAAANPCKSVTPPRRTHYDIPTLGPDDLSRLLNAIRHSSYYLVYHTLLLTGLRRNELLALKWKDLDLELACIYVSHSLQRLRDGRIIIKQPKTPRSRRLVDLPPSLVALLRQHRLDQEANRILFGESLKEDDFVFGRSDGSPLYPSTVTDAFAKVAAQAGLPHLRLHDLRHIHATMMLKMGIHPRVVQERLGHSSIATTLDVYSHTVPGLQRMAAERLDSLLSQEVSSPNFPSHMMAEG
jgi:integrase